jgi:hypothetical protein
MDNLTIPDIGKLAIDRARRERLQPIGSIDPFDFRMLSCN